jgi:protocatechuate 3,4-dioxygenase beta subunit
VAGLKQTPPGKYFIYTVKPGTYPTNDEPAHIHVTIKEPNEIKEYCIDAFVFDDDRLLTGEKRKALENRGGSGILRLVDANGLWVAEHNIVLGVNIPSYPRKMTSSVINTSGLQIGEDNPSFIPFHAWGPDKGTRTCPVCKYGRYHGIVYFVGNNPDWADIKKWLKYLEGESIKRKKYLKAYFAYGNEKGYSKKQRQEELEKIGTELGLKNIALTYVPSMTDTESEVNLNKINPAVKNTFVIYTHHEVVWEK